MSEKRGLIFDIQGFSVHDGPGCRTLVFLKGCPLRCGWCSNPEGIDPFRELMYSQSQCIGDYACRDACKSQAIQAGQEGGPIVIEREQCQRCSDLECVDACDHNALRVAGHYTTVAELMNKIQRDRAYWGTGGGITLSGGEPMFQHEFTGAVLRRCYESYIHTAMETSGYAPWKHYQEVLPDLDWLFFDLKHMDPDMHKGGTGVSNELILDNARKIASEGECRLIFRMVMIPGFNDSLENLTATAEFMHSIDKKEINILSLHHLGSSKYDMLGREYPFRDRKGASSERMEEARAFFVNRSIECWVGSNTPF
ncbi:MAG: glycyl-radical enzyme activating protein [Thermoplasmata archaeon]|nr:glycyl-radical enzyme activating protein [Thermoplasmata archaeon]